MLESEPTISVHSNSPRNPIKLTMDRGDDSQKSSSQTYTGLAPTPSLRSDMLKPARMVPNIKVKMTHKYVKRGTKMNTANNVYSLAETPNNYPTT